MMIAVVIVSLPSFLQVWLDPTDLEVRHAQPETRSTAAVPPTLAHLNHGSNRSDGRGNAVTCFLACILVAGSSYQSTHARQLGPSHHLAIPTPRMSLSRNLITSLRVSRTRLAAVAVPSRTIAVRGFAKTALVREDGYDKHRVQVCMVSFRVFATIGEADCGFLFWCQVKEPSAGTTDDSMKMPYVEVRISARTALRSRFIVFTMTWYHSSSPK
jgi:hypothetical protein